MPRKTTEPAEVTLAADVAVDTNTAEPTATPDSNQKAEPKKQYKVKKQLDPHTVVSVRSGFNGVLVYKSKHTGEVFEWADLGDEQEMELLELRSAKASTDKVFFENNWFIIDDPEVIEYLGIEKYYKNSLKLEEFDTLFDLTPDEVATKISKMPKGQRMTVAYRARKLIDEGEIDSIKMINALEKSLGVELIEK